jgi:SAM-dependent methyltransferase
VVNKLDLKRTYQAWVDHWTAERPRSEGMSLAVGGNFELVGGIECALLKHYGLRPEHALIDVGCGSGRLAKPLASYLRGRYLGTDLVADLLDHARTITGRPDWRFEAIDHIGIPERDGCADMVCFFSVLTHLLHEQSYWYLQEAKRVLKPGGRIVFSFLEFSEPQHWEIFLATLGDARAGGSSPLNVFLDRSAIGIWADHLGLRVDDLRGASEAIVPEGALGQSVCVMSVPCQGAERQGAAA